MGGALEESVWRGEEVDSARRESCPWSDDAGEELVCWARGTVSRHVDIVLAGAPKYVQRKTELGDEVARRIVSIAV